MKKSDYSPICYREFRAYPRIWPLAWTALHSSWKTEKTLGWSWYSNHDPRSPTWWFLSHWPGLAASACLSQPLFSTSRRPAALGRWTTSAHPACAAFKARERQGEAAGSRRGRGRGCCALHSWKKGLAIQEHGCLKFLTLQLSLFYKGVEECWWTMCWFSFCLVTAWVLA